MLALDFVKANRATVEKAIRDKGVDLDLVVVDREDPRQVGALGEADVG
jgi:hypothetical protein